MAPYVKKIDYTDRWGVYLEPFTLAHWGRKAQIYKTREEAEAAIAAKMREEDEPRTVCPSRE
jgi:hypothetical protein